MAREGSDMTILDLGDDGDREGGGGRTSMTRPRSPGYSQAGGGGGGDGRGIGSTAVAFEVDSGLGREYDVDLDMDGGEFRRASTGRTVWSRLALSWQRFRESGWFVPVVVAVSILGLVGFAALFGGGDLGGGSGGGSGGGKGEGAAGGPPAAGGNGTEAPAGAGGPPEAGVHGGTDGVRFLGAPAKSLEDARAYRVVELDGNGLRAMVVSHGGAESRSGAALDVSVGSLWDPYEFPGVAHFLEHMVFMGSGEFPEENGFAAYLGAHGGSHNAFTAQDHTNFFFEVESGALRGGLERFAGFFIDPLLAEESAEREVLAVANEHAKNMEDDAWRAWELLKVTSGPERSLFRKFSTGNGDTLDPDLGTVAQMRAFHDSHYTADRMALVVVGAEDPDTLEEWVVELFAGVPAGKGTSDGAGAAQAPSDVVAGDDPSLVRERVSPAYGDASELPWQAGYLGKVSCMETIMRGQSITLVWPLPPSGALAYRAAAAAYVESVLLSSGDGSLVSTLQDQGWATSLDAGLDQDTPLYGTFTLQIELSASGFNARTDVVRMVFDYLRLLSGDTDSHQERRWNEAQTLRGQRFDYRQVSNSPSSFSSDVAGILLQRTPSDALGSPENYARDAASITALLHVLEDPGKCVVQVLYGPTTMSAVAGEGEDPARPGEDVNPFGPDPRDSWVLPVGPAWELEDPTLTEPYYGFNYSFSAVPGGVMGFWDNLAGGELVSLKLPGINMYVQEVLTAPTVEAADIAGCGEGEACEDGGEPALVTQVDYYLPDMKVWLKRDARFHEPRAYLVCLLRTPRVFEQRDRGKRGTRHDRIGASLLLDRLLRRELREDLFQAREAGIAFSMGVVEEGIKLAFEGFTGEGDGLGRLVRAVTDKLKDLPSWITAADAETGADDPRLVFERTTLAEEVANMEFGAAYDAGARRMLKTALVVNPFDAHETAELIERFTAETLLLQMHRILEKFVPECVAVGALDETKAFSLADFVAGIKPTYTPFDPDEEDHAPGEADDPHDFVFDGPYAYTREYLQPSVVELEPGERLLLQGDAPEGGGENHAIWSRYIAGYDVSIETRASTAFLAYLVREPVFDVLRTQEALGYIVTALFSDTWGMVGVDFVVQSSTHSADVLEGRLEAFLASFEDEFETSVTGNETVFQARREAFARGLVAADVSLADEAARVVAAALNGDYEVHETWHLRLRVAEAVRELTPAKTLDAYRSLFTDPASRTKLSAEAFAPGFIGVEPGRTVPYPKPDGYRSDEAIDFRTQKFELEDLTRWSRCDSSKAINPVDPSACTL